MKYSVRWVGCSWRDVFDLLCVLLQLSRKISGSAEGWRQLKDENLLVLFKVIPRILVPL